jgi:2-polyprenyl-3-methyl-5-hydroxy-6-metoxy-1,4-benzoquinol methylase
MGTGIEQAAPLRIETPRWAGIGFPRARFLAELIPGGEVLDIGCAGHVVKPESDDWLHGALARRCRVTGIDISEDNIRRMRELGFADTHVGSAEDFHLGRKFDAVVAGEVIEHLSNPGRFLECAKLHLKENGKIVISTPYVFSLVHVLYALRHYPRTCQNRQHSLWLCPSTLAELAARAGLRIERAWLIYEYDPGERSLPYRLYWTFLKTVGFLVPERLRRNTLVLELRSEDSR